MMAHKLQLNPDKAELLPMPQVVMKILEIDENNIKISSGQLRDLVAVDPFLTSKILKLANSAFYARSGGVKSLTDAITLLGFKTIKSLTLLVSATKIFHHDAMATSVKKELWMRSVLRALIARLLAEKTGHRHLMEEAFMSSLLKNMGLLIVCNQYPHEYEQVFRDSEMGADLLKLHNLEKEKFAYTSPQVAGIAMKAWKFPPVFIQVAELYSNHLGQAREHSGISGVLSVVADAIIFLNEMVDAGGMTEHTLQDYQEVFEQYFSEISPETREYFLSGLKEAILQDSYYTFSLEMFQM